MTAQTSTEANPTHTYAEAKRYTATLTVTYGDGGTDSNTIDVDVLAQADETAPTTTAALNPADAGQRRHLHAAGHGHADRHRRRRRLGRRHDRVPRQRRRVPDLHGADHAARSRASTPIEFRSTDITGNVEATKSVTFTIAVPDNCPTNLNDEFDGPARRRSGQCCAPLRRIAFVDGRLRIKVRNGDMIGDRPRRRTCCCRTRPDGSWQATTKLDVSTLTTAGDQAGFVLWTSENPNTFAKITYISKGTTQQYEWVATRNGTIRN